MGILLICLFVLLGMAVGSFLNVCIDRLPGRKSLISPPSHCDACGRKLALPDLIPVFSYLWLRGRCRTCGAQIPARVFWVELATAVAFALLLWKYTLTTQLPVMLFYFSVLLVLAVIDLEHKLLLNRIIYPAAVIAIIISVFLPEPGWQDCLIGGAIGLGILLIPVLVYPKGMGWGDVKMAGLLGLMNGFPGVFVAVLGGIVLGGLTAVFLILLKTKSRKDTMPFGPFLAVGAMLALVWGRQVIDWYLTLF